MSKSPLVSKLLEQISLQIKGFTHLTVAYSGGLDSSVLLHLCKAMREQNNDIQLQAVHVNHGLSKHALSWENHCRAICESWQIPLNIQSVTITPKSRTSLEQQAREARYHAIQQAVTPQNLILLGQHQDDQAETYILQLARGAGAEGLSGMPERYTSATGHQFARPLLSTSRKQLLEYGQACQLSWIEDDSNSNENFYRNFVRHQVMPVLQEKWPSIASTISRSAKHHAQSAAVVDEYMTLLSESIIDAQGLLQISSWLELSAPSQMAMLRFWLKPRVAKMPSAAVLTQIFKLASAPQDAQPECCWGEDMVSRYAGKLYVRKLDNNPPPKPFDVLLHDNVAYSHSLLPYRIELNSDQAHTEQSLTFCTTNKTLTVEFGGYSKVCKLESKRPSKSIKKWFQEWRLPPWERTRVPILMHGETVLAVGGYLAIFEPLQIEQKKQETIRITLHADKKSPHKAGKD